MNEINQYIFNTIKMHVWGGFDTQEDIQEMISDILRMERMSKCSTSKLL